MELNPTADQQMLSDMLNRFLAERYPLEARARLADRPPGYSPEAWTQLAELGVLGALFDPAAGGYGGAPGDIKVVFEALGRGAVAGPFLPSLMAGSVLASVATAAAQDLLSAIIGGEAIVAFAHQEPRSRYELSRVETRAEKAASGWRLNGTKSVVAFAEAASHIIVSTRSSGSVADEAGLSLFLVPVTAAGLTIQGYPMVDGPRAAEVALKDVEVPQDALLSREGGAFALIEQTAGLGILALCADAMGALDVVKESTVEYLQTRVQFGQPIGSFQALQHRMATLLIEIEQARSALFNAMAAFHDVGTVRERALSAAKYTLGRVGALVAEEAVQLHGGIGMTWELPLSHYVKRLIVLDHQLGDVDHHIERYVALGRAA